MEKLTPRERQVLELSSYGLSVKEISYELDIKSATVKVHLRKIHLKTGLQNDRETTALYWTEKANISIFSMPEKIRQRIATALLALSIFSMIFQPVNLINFFRVARTRTLTSQGARARRQDEVTNLYNLTYEF